MAHGAPRPPAVDDGREWPDIKSEGGEVAPPMTHTASSGSESVGRASSGGSRGSRASAMKALLETSGVSREGPWTVLGRRVSRFVLLERMLRGLYWCTYRYDLDPIPALPHTSGSSALRTDSGWGCTLRSAQMLVGHALRRHLRSDWEMSVLEGDTDAYVGRLLADVPSRALSPYGLHSLCSAAPGVVGKGAGSWFGPQAACRVMAASGGMHERMGGVEGRQLRLGVGTDSCVYADQVVELSEDWRCGVLLLVPLRLGLDRVGEEGAVEFRKILALPWSVGAIGGRPRHSVYFVGFDSSNSFLFLDPHKSRPFPSDPSGVPSPASLLETFRLPHPALASLQCIPPAATDPSCAVGFLLQSQTDLDNLTEALRSLDCIAILPHTPSDLLRNRDGSSRTDVQTMTEGWGIEGPLRTKPTDAQRFGFDEIHEAEGEVDGFVVL